MIIVEDVEQRNEAWFRLKSGVISGSNFDQIITGTGNPVKKEKTERYLMRLAAERVTGQYLDQQEASYWMARGTELEDEARETLAFILGAEIRSVGFIFRDTSKTIGISPDGIIEASSGATGDFLAGVEIKCPKASTHVKYLMENHLPLQYIPQVQGSLWVTGFKKWIFMSYFPGLKPFLLEVFPDIPYQIQLEKLVARAVARIDEICARIK